MFLIRAAFWVAVVVLLLPTDEAQQARLARTVSTAYERATTFCDRNPGPCAAAADAWAAFVRKAEFGGRMLWEAIDRQTRDQPPAGMTPASGRRSAPPTWRGDLTPNDLGPPWRANDPRRRGA